MVFYTLEFERYYEHLVQITMHFTANTDDPALWLPTWVPGSYLIREFSRHVGRLTYQVNNDESRIAQKTTKNRWQLEGIKSGDAVELSYDVYAYDLSVRGSYVSQERLYGNFATLCITPQGQENEPITLDLAVPEFFENTELACTLPAKRLDSGYQLSATSYTNLIDHPFEVAKQQRFSFDVNEITHQFVVSGRHDANLPRLADDLQKICQTYLDWLGDAPFTQYLFMTIATGSDYGGLEHQNCTSLITSRADLPSVNEPEEPSKNYRRFLGLCSHEYFHAWLDKKIRPENMLNPDLNTEVYTSLLWVFEGFTSYFDDLMLLRSGVIGVSSYFELLAEHINRYLQTHGRAHQSVSESSFDAWIKLYRSDENTANAGVSYYNKGLLVALCLDLLLQKHGSRLEDLVKRLYAQAKQGVGVTDENLDSLMNQILPDDVWQDFRAKYIDGVDELPLIDYLNDFGVKLKQQQKSWPLGMLTVAEDQGLKVTRVLRQSAAAKAGISANDVIVAINGIKASEALLKKVDAMGEQISCHFFRRDELCQACVSTSPVKVPLIQFKTRDLDNDVLAGWLKGLG